MEDETVKKQIEFLKLVGRLKHVKRTGWVLRDVKDPESIASHMYRMAMMVFLLDNPKINKYRCMEMALVHDLAECIVGDITPYCGISKEAKHKKEYEAMEYISKLIGKNGDYIKELYAEFEEQVTEDAQFVKELDLLDMALQATEYESEEGSPGRLQDFIDSTASRFSNPFILDIMAHVLRDREKAIAEKKERYVTY